MEEEITQYEIQLSQIQKELNVCTDSEKKASLVSLQNDLTELIQLTRVSLSQQDSEKEGSLDAEYALFKAELARENDSGDSTVEIEGKIEDESFNELQDDLMALPGMKCQAPFTYAWSDEAVYQNALVYKVEGAKSENSCDDIVVRVMFTNPTHDEMKPCPFYLDGKCKFSESDCRFSHGEIVNLSSLQDFKEPDFNTISAGCHVLVKLEDNLWHRATVVASSDSCVVKVEASSKEIETSLENILPLDSLSQSDNSTDESEDEGGTRYTSAEQDVQVITKKISIVNSSTGMLGEWEQYTKGFGSRIMAQMGYIHGSGLGSNANGRVEPVSAVVYPSGKSLDHCMMLKEKAGGDQDLFKAERKMRKFQRKHEIALNKSYEREKQRKDVFTVLNETVNHSSSHNISGLEIQKELREEPQKGLQVSSFRIAEDVKKTEKEMHGLTKSLARHASSSPLYSVIKGKIKNCESRLSHLQESERKVHSELQQRQDRKKLTVF